MLNIKITSETMLEGWIGLLLGCMQVWKNLGKTQV